MKWMGGTTGSTGGCVGQARPGPSLWSFRSFRSFTSFSEAKYNFPSVIVPKCNLGTITEGKKRAARKGAGHCSLATGHWQLATHPRESRRRSSHAISSGVSLTSRASTLAWNSVALSQPTRANTSSGEFMT
jgi:hypothetical protein